jgi:hypothetical protein
MLGKAVVSLVPIRRFFCTQKEVVMTVKEQLAQYFEEKKIDVLETQVLDITQIAEDLGVDEVETYLALKELQENE